MPVTIEKISAERAGQRVDNFLINKLKGVPKSRIYRAIRKGEVRVNGKRVKAEYKLALNDELRIPPIRQADAKQPVKPGPELAAELERRVIYEDQRLLIIDKPAGLPVHGGTEVSAGLIEMLRQMRPQAKFLELVHRLDRDTSGLLLIAKKRRCLLELHEQITQRHMKKHYLAWVKGRLKKKTTVDAPLLKNQLKSGERVVRVNPEGKPARTIFTPLKYKDGMTMVKAELITGRTHQIRVHAQHIGHPIVGDQKYGDDDFNHEMRRKGIKHLCLHSAELHFRLSEPVEQFALCCFTQSI